MLSNRDKNLICIPFAFKEGANGGVNISGSAYTTYLKNACVSLCSAKYYNPQCEVCFATNIKEIDIPMEYRNIFSNAGITVRYVPFDYFVFPDDYLWSLAFYKLCVLKYFSEEDYQNICYMDTDVYVQGSFDDIWEECNQNILLYDINHGLGVSNYKCICEEFENFLGERKYITHYGGEFFAASSELSREFCKKIQDVYDKMIETQFVTNKGDEFILSIAADLMRERIKNAGAYIHRFWTGIGFRLISSCYRYNRVTILHLPAEKNTGIIKMYNNYIKKGNIPLDKIVWKCFRLSSEPLKDKIIKLGLKILKK